MSANTSADAVKTILSKLRFARVGDEYPTGVKINIDVEKNGVARLIDEKGVKHYYYRDQVAEFGWSAAYTRAKNRNLRGLKGYLVTITNTKEQDFFGDATLDSDIIAPYYIGGTRSVKSLNSQKINDDNSLIGLFGVDLTKLDDKKVQYYWADGPETGKVFWNNVNIKNQAGNVGEYTYWGSYSSTKTDGYLTAGNGLFQEKYQWVSHPLTTLVPATPMVEFSEYGGQKETTQDFEATVPDEIKEGQVVEHYVDAEGNKIVDDAVILGNVGDSYTAEQKDLTSKGYEFDKIAEGSAPEEGTVTLEQQHIIFQYIKK